jgi:curli biogenesis system outer membrane secretion channel CsgG
VGRIFGVIGAFFLIFAITGCALIRPKAGVEPTAGMQALPPYSGPKARIAVADLEVKVASTGGKIGSGLRDMLITALINSNRFSVVERQAREIVMKEQEPSASEVTDGAIKTERDKISAADIIVSGAVTEFEPQASGGRAGVGGGGGVGSGILGGLLGGSVNKAHLALDIRIVDVSTSGVLSTTRVEGQASDISGAIMTGFLRGYGLGGGLSTYANTPMEKAIRICIIEAVRHIAEITPADYYKY